MNLDTQQQTAIKTTSPRALVLAGAGSGKTRVLIERIAWLIETQKVSPTEIMAFSFTRKASGEIRDRLKERIGGKANGVQMGTMHGLALEFIHRFGEAIGLRPANVTVYGDWESGYLLADVAQEMSAKKPALKAAKEALEQYYQTGEKPKEDDPGRDLFMVFLARCRENNSLTYGALLVGLRLLVPTLAKYLHVCHILVDEIQDIDPLQWAIINEMVFAFKANLFVAGDIDQSIYEFRGAVPKYLVDHAEEFDIYRLEANYRSVPSIVEAANRLIEHNQDRITKTMRATREIGGALAVLGAVSSEQIFAISKGVKEIDGVRYVPESIEVGGPVAILARKHSLLGKIDRLMEEAGIPHTYIGKTTALTNSEPFRRFHAFLKLAVNPFDNFSFLLIRDIIGLSREEYGRVRLDAADKGRSHFQVFLGNTDFLKFQVYFDNTLSGFAEYVNSAYPDLSPESLAFIQKWTSEHSDDIASYLDWLATFDVQDELKGEIEGITLSTIHAAKGLEWPVVIVAGCNEGIIPARPNDPDEIEGERRLMYVAMTRAMDQLMLTVRPTESTDAAGRVHKSPESRFIMELQGD
jgi:DNA helicase-2/ATP-dependent DNA helicase PcrA